MDWPVSGVPLDWAAPTMWLLHWPAKEITNQTGLTFFITESGFHTSTAVTYHEPTAM